MKKTLFIKILFSLLIISFFVTPFVFASESVKATEITPRAVAQEVRSEYHIYQEQQDNGTWQNFKTVVKNKTLYPPNGYMYQRSGQTRSVEGPYQIYSSDRGKRVWVRVIQYEYSYKLVRI